MAKNILAVIAGLAAAMAIFMLFEQVSHSFYPLPADLDYNDKEKMKNYIQVLPAGSLVLVLAGWLTGSVVAGFIIKLISKSGKKMLPLIAGIILTASAIVNMIMLPHPIWFIVIGILIFIPAVFTGYGLKSFTGNRTAYSSTEKL